MSNAGSVRGGELVQTESILFKRRQMAERHLPGSPNEYQEDHLIPLELGGHPTDPKTCGPSGRQRPCGKTGWSGASIAQSALVE